MLSVLTFSKKSTLSGYLCKKKNATSICDLGGPRQRHPIVCLSGLVIKPSRFRQSRPTWERFSAFARVFDLKNTRISS